MIGRCISDAPSKIVEFPSGRSSDAGMCRWVGCRPARVPAGIDLHRRLARTGGGRICEVEPAHLV